MYKKSDLIFMAFNLGVSAIEERQFATVKLFQFLALLSLQPLYWVAVARLLQAYLSQRKPNRLLKLPLRVIFSCSFTSFCLGSILSFLRDSYTKTLTTEIRKIWGDIETWMKGGLIYKEAKADENRHFTELGFNYGLSSNFHLQFTNGYEKCNSHNSSAELIKFGGGINFKLPLPMGMEFQNSLNVNKTIEEEDINYQFMSSITIPRS